MKCGLDSCDDIPKYIIPDKDLDDVPNSSLVHFSVYTYQGRCAKHGIVLKKPTLCKICE